MKKLTTFLGVIGLALAARAADPAAPAAPAATSMEAPSAAMTETSAAPAGVELLSSGVGTAVENRELLGEGTSFTSPGPVAFLTKVKASSTPTTVKHIWSADGNVVSEVELEIKGSPWRTFSRKTVWPGAWKVELADGSGTVLGAQEFTVTGGEPAPTETIGADLIPKSTQGQ